MSDNTSKRSGSGEVISTSGSSQQQTANLRSLHKKVELKHPCSKNWLIHLHYVRREFQACKAVIHEEIHRMNGNSEYANYILALILRSEGKMQESLDRLQTCHELEPTNANTVNQIARSLFLLGRHKLAIDAYQKAQLLNEESDSESHYNMGMCYLFMKDLEKAKEHMNLSLQSRVSYDALEVLAQIALAKNNIPEAINVYEKAIKIFPEKSALLSSVGVLYMKTGKDETAFLKLSAALAYEATNSKAIVATASMMQTYEDYDYALAKYKIAMQKIPDSASLWNNIGMCFFGKRKFVAAISCLKRACYLSPFDWKILHNLGLVHLHMQQHASAFHFLTSAINLKPDQSQNFVLLATAISNLEDVEHARMAYEQCILLNAHNNETTPSYLLYLNYAICLFNHKLFAEAAEKLAVMEKIAQEENVTFDDEVNDAVTRLTASLQIIEYSDENAEKLTKRFNQQKQPLGTMQENLEEDLV